MNDFPPARFDADPVPGSPGPQPGAEPVALAEAEPAGDDIAYDFMEGDDAFAGSADAEPPQPQDPVTDSAAVYIAELEQAARHALHHRQAARLAEQGAWLVSNLAPQESPDRATNFPPDVVGQLLRSALASARGHADELAAFTAAWYARAVIAAFRAARSGDRPTGLELEGEVFNPAELPEPAGEPSGPPWRSQYRPDLPDPAEFTTGQSDLDQAIADVHGQLAAVYAAAQTAEVLSDASKEPGAGAEQDALLIQATQIADQLPDLLTWWAGAAAAVLHRRLAASEQS